MTTHRSPFWRNVLPCALALFGMFTSSKITLAYQIQPDFVMFHDPEFDFAPVIRKLDEGLLPLWREVLLRPESEYQRQAAEAIAHVAESGFHGSELAKDDLHTLLTTTVHADARYAAARALIAIDARSSANELFTLSQQYDSQLRLLIEPALAEWGFVPVAEVWRDRVRDADSNRRELLLALSGLARMQDREILSDIVDIILSDSRPYNVRMVAAQAAGELAETGLEPAVERLLNLDHPNIPNRLCAVALLSRHDSELACNQLMTLAHDAEPTVVEQALGRLNEIDPELVIPLAEEARTNPDPKVRRRVADTYVSLATPERIGFLCEMLNDDHPDVRTSVRENLFTLASRQELDTAVRDSTNSILEGDNWRGQEQAALLLGALDHEPAAARMLELLTSDRGEVEIASAYGLKMLAVPETLPDSLEHARRRTADRQQQRVSPGLDKQLAQLFEFFAMTNYEPAEDLLREYVPKNTIMGYHSRGAAIWALGHLHAGVPDEQLAIQLMERINDMDPYHPEMDIVLRMSAISLGRMHAESQLEPMRLRGTSGYDPLSYAIRWSILQITGEEIPPPPPIVRGTSGWFLEPIVDVVSEPAP